jgi:hypothetical protein
MQLPKSLATPDIKGLKGPMKDVFRKLIEGIKAQHRQIRNDINTNFIYNLKSGATQAAAKAKKNERWYTSGHATLPDNVMMIGV